MRQRYLQLGALLALGIVLFGISGISRFKNATHGVDWVIGGIGWFGGCLCILAFLGLTIWTFVASRRQRATA
jgi:hypothetical protein